MTHCQGGGRASVDSFALERLGIPTRNYYLGWSDWGNAEETPVVAGENRGRKDVGKPCTLWNGRIFNKSDTIVKVDLLWVTILLPTTHAVQPRVLELEPVAR